MPFLSIDNQNKIFYNKKATKSAAENCGFVLNFTKKSSYFLCNNAYVYLKRDSRSEKDFLSPAITGYKMKGNAVIMIDINQAYIAGAYYSPSSTTYLNLAGTPLSYSDVVSIGTLVNLTYLNLNNTGIDDVMPFSELSELTILSLAGNKISDPSPLANLTKLTYLDLRENPLRQDRTEILENRLTVCNLIYDVFDSELNLPVEINGGTHLSLETTELEFTDTVLTKDDCVNISRLVNLSELTVTRCKIECIEALGECENLYRLNLNETDPADLKLISRLGKLETLDIYNSGFTNLKPLSELASLEQLFLNVNGIEDISPLSGLVGLRTLSLNVNRISDISALTRLTELTALELWGNQISDISPLAALVYLSKLNLFDNRISDLSPLANHLNLVKLNLKKNQITDITPLANLRGLKNLYLIANPFTPEQREAQRGLLPNCKVWW